jgi:hypothetical protein
VRGGRVLKAESKKQKAKSRKQKAESRKQKAKMDRDLICFSHTLPSS